MSTYGFLRSWAIVFPITSKQILIGRSQTCHIVLSHPSISKEHALINFEEEGNNPTIR